MNLELPSLAVDLAVSATRAVLDAGGLELARRAEADPAERQRAFELWEALGVGDLDPYRDAECALAAGELCRVAGRFAMPYPLASWLARRAGPGPLGVALVDERAPWVEHADLDGTWRCIDGAGYWRAVRPVSSRRDRTLAPFAVKVELGPPQELADPLERALLMDLDCCRILGTLEAALALAVDHVGSREQFGQLLASFQGVRFHVADATVALGGLRQLVHFTLWRLQARPEQALVDALALRSFALETARSVVSVAELLHGATAFASEHDLSVLTRMVQAPLRLPVDLERTTALLVAAIDESGFDSLFEQASPAPPAASGVSEGGFGG